MSKGIITVGLLLVASAVFLFSAMVAGGPKTADAWELCGAIHPATAFPIKVYVDPTIPVLPGREAQYITYEQLSAATDAAWQDWANLPDSDITFVRVATRAEATHVVQLAGWLTNPLPSTAESHCYYPGYFPQNTYVLSTFANWDTDPSDGVTPGKKSLNHVMRHEIGHILGLMHKCIGTADIMCSDGQSTPLGVNWPVDPDSQAAMAHYHPLQGVPSGASPTPTATLPSAPAPVCREAYYRDGVLAQGAIRACP